MVQLMRAESDLAMSCADAYRRSPLILRLMDVDGVRAMLVLHPMGFIRRHEHVLMEFDLPPGADIPDAVYARFALAL